MAIKTLNFCDANVCQRNDHRLDARHMIVSVFVEDRHQSHRHGSDGSDGSDVCSICHYLIDSWIGSNRDCITLIDSPIDVR